MASNSTVGSITVGTVTVSASGAQTGTVLAGLQNIINAAAAAGDVTSIASGATSIPAPTTSPAVLAISAGVSGTLSIPGGYQVVAIDPGATVSLTGADSNTAIVGSGPLNFTGTAGTVAASGGGSTISDSLSGATIAIGGTGNTVTAVGDGDTFIADPGAGGDYSVTGLGDTIVIGTPSTPTASPQAAAVSSVVAVPQTTVHAGSSSTVLLTDTLGAVVALSGTANTVSAVAGTSTVFGSHGGDVYFGSAAAVYFVGSSGSVVAVSTVFGGTAGDTVFGNSGVDYTAGSGGNIFVGGSSTIGSAVHSTITGTTGNDTLFGGTQGDLYNLGQANNEFVAGGGVDSMFGGTSGPTIFGATGEDLSLYNTSLAQVVNSGVETINAALANQGTTFFTSDGVGAGNSTLIGSAVAPVPGQPIVDRFAVTSVAGGTGTAHTLTIENWHQGDAFYLLNYGTADEATFAAAVTAANTAGTALTFTLSDNTTVSFTGNHPTATFAGGTIAL